MKIELQGLGKTAFNEYDDEGVKNYDLEIETDVSGRDISFDAFIKNPSETNIKFIQQAIENREELYKQARDYIFAEKNAGFINGYVEDLHAFLMEDDNYKEYLPQYDEGMKFADYFSKNLFCKGFLIGQEVDKNIDLNIDFLIGENEVFLDNLLTVEFSDDFTITHVIDEG